MIAVVAHGAGGPEVLDLREVPNPEPASDEVLIKVAATSVNRADLNQRAGRSNRPAGEVLGLEASGHIVRLGADVTQWSVGDRVCTLLDSGGYAEVVAAPADTLIEVPASMDLTTAGAFAEVFLTAFDALELRARCKAGETVLVHGGAGGLGTASIQMGTAMGCRVLATVRREAQRDACHELGAEVVLMSDDDHPTRWDETVRSLTGDEGADVILDILGSEAWERNLSLLAPDGRLVVLGTLTGSRVELDLKDLMRLRRSVFAATMRGRHREQKAALVHTFVNRWSEAMAGGRLRPVVAECIPLREVALGHRMLEEGGHVGKIVIQVSGTEEN